MKKPHLLAALAAAALTVLPSLSYAQFSGNVGLTTDYRYRGISQTRLKPALQGGVDYGAAGRLLRRRLGLDDQVDQGHSAATPASRSTSTAATRARSCQDLGFDVGVLTLPVPEQQAEPQRQHHRAVRRADLRPGDAASTRTR